MGSPILLNIPISSILLSSLCVTFINGKGMQRGVGMEYGLASSRMEYGVVFPEYAKALKQAVHLLPQVSF